MRVAESFILVVWLSACGTSPDPNPQDGAGGTANGGGGGAGSGATTSVGGGTGGGGDGGGGAGGQTPTGSHLFVGVGNWGLRSSTSDGLDWHLCRNPSTGNDHSPDLLRNVAYGDGVFVAVGGDQNSMVMRSLDGVHWEEDLHPTDSCSGEAYPPSCTNWMGGVAYGDGVWLAGGGNGALMRSTDAGVSWQGIHPDPTPNAIRSIAFGAGTFVAGTDGGVVIVSTDDGDSWTAHDEWQHSMSIAFGGGTFIAKGQNWNGSGFDYGCSISTDAGVTWSACATDILTSGPVVWDGSRWVSAGGAGYFESSDGLSWTPQTATNFPSEYLFGDQLWLGLRGGDAYTSQNLTDWQSAATDVPGFRAWVGGLVYDGNLPVTGIPACEDNG